MTIHSVYGPDGNRIAEYNEATGALIRQYIWLEGAPIAVVEVGVISFVRSDHIGRPVFATNASGVKVWTAAYLPFGGVRVSTGTPPTARFPGQWFPSETGLHQNWMRDYDPTTGRYMQADPLGLVDGASVYGYAEQNPGRYVDPRGESTIRLSPPPNITGQIEGLQCVATTTEECEAGFDAANAVCRAMGGGDSTAARRARQICYQQANDQYAECLASAGRGHTWPMVPPLIIPSLPRPNSPSGGGGRGFPYNFPPIIVF